MANPAPPIDADLEAVTAALTKVEPRPGRVLLFGSRARGDARPDSDLDLLVVMPQATLTPQERQQALRSLRAALRPLPLSVGVDLVVVGEEDARRLAGSRWHVVARALREGKELHLGSLRGTLDPGTFAEEDWGFLAQQTLERLLKALLVLHCQEPPRSHSLQRLLQELVTSWCWCSLRFSTRRYLDWITESKCLGPVIIAIS